MLSFDSTLTGTFNSADNGAPSVFVEQLCEGRPYADITFPDAFEICPGSWNFKTSTADASKEKLPNIHEKFALQMGSQVLDSRLMRQRGIHEEQRVQLRHRRNKRVALQNTAGQAVYESENYNPGATASIATSATAERLRREETRDWAHAVWATQNRAIVEWHTKRRIADMASLRARRQERVELEHYAGSTRDKLILSQKRRMQLTNASARWGECQNDIESITIVE